MDLKELIENCKNVEIFHHFDADGYASAAIIGAYFLNHITGEFRIPVNFHSVNHRSPMKLADFNINDETLIFILDYSFSRKDDQDELLSLINQEKNIVWIDHHDTSKVIEANDKFKNLPGIRILDKNGVFDPSGCYLSWIWIIAALNNIDIRNVLKHPSYSVITTWLLHMSTYSPKWIRLISDYDTWTMSDRNSAPFVKALNFYGLGDTLISKNEKSFMTYYSDEIYFCKLDDSKISGVTDPIVKFNYELRTRLVQLSHTENREWADKRVEEIVAFGETLKEIDSIRNKRNVQNNSWESTIEISVRKDIIDPKGELNIEGDNNGIINRRFELLSLNAPGNSAMFGDEFEKYDAVSTVTFNGENFMYSFYSRKNNGAECHLIALAINMLYGITGGGHEHAAGCVTPEPILWKNKITRITDRNIEFV